LAGRIERGELVLSQESLSNKWRFINGSLNIYNFRDKYQEYKLLGLHRNNS